MSLPYNPYHPLHLQVISDRRGDKQIGPEACSYVYMGIKNTQLPKHPNTQGNPKFQKRTGWPERFLNFVFGIFLGIWVLGSLGIFNAHRPALSRGSTGPASPAPA